MPHVNDLLFCFRSGTLPVGNPAFDLVVPARALRWQLEHREPVNGHKCVALR